MAGFRLVQDLTRGADRLLVSSGAVISCRGAAVVAAVGLQGHIATTAGVLILGAHSAAPVCETRRTEFFALFRFGDCTTKGADRVPSISITVNAIVVTVMSWWQAAVFRAVPVQCYISTATGPLLPGAEVPALVATVAAGGGVVTNTLVINVMGIGIIKAGSATGF